MLWSEAAKPIVPASTERKPQSLITVEQSRRMSWPTSRLEKKWCGVLITSGTIVVGNYAMTSGFKFSSIKHFSRKDVVTGACTWHLITTTFETHVNGDATVVGALAKRWCKGFMHPELKCQCHRTGPLPSYCASACKCHDNTHDVASHFLEVCISAHFLFGYGTPVAT